MANLQKSELLWKVIQSQMMAHGILEKQLSKLEITMTTGHFSPTSKMDLQKMNMTLFYFSQWDQVLKRYIIFFYKFSIRVRLPVKEAYPDDAWKNSEAICSIKLEWNPSRLPIMIIKDLQHNLWAIIQNVAF